MNSLSKSINGLNLYWVDVFSFTLRSLERQVLDTAFMFRESEKELKENSTKGNESYKGVGTNSGHDGISQNI